MLFQGYNLWLGRINFKEKKQPNKTMPNTDELLIESTNLYKFSFSSIDII